MTPNELTVHWRKNAESVEHYGDATIAKALRTCADELEASLHAAENDVVDLAAASKLSGYSVDRLRHKVAAKEIPNAGRPGAPRVRVGDLPLKKRANGNGFDAASVARAVMDR